MDPIVLGMLIVGLAAFFLLTSQWRWFSWKWIGKGMVHFVLGIFLLFFINIFGSFFDFHLPYNLITIAITGFLGIPGALALIVIKLFII